RRLHGARRQTALVTAVHGHCLPLGIELRLASDIGVAEESARFGQIEINRGIFPFGGATLRLPLVAGWGNAMRWLLTGDVFDAKEAQRIGLVSDVVAKGTHLDAAIAIAETIASRAPLGVRATIASARTPLHGGPDAAAGALLAQAGALRDSEDAAEGLRSFVERRDARFTGR